MQLTVGTRRVISAFFLALGSFRFDGDSPLATHRS
jgi:hypothetical protein